MTVPAGRSSSTAHWTVTADLETAFSDDVIAEGFPGFLIVALRRGLPGDVIADDFVAEGLPRMNSRILDRLSSEWVSIDDVIAEGFPCIADDVTSTRATYSNAARKSAIGRKVDYVIREPLGFPYSTSPPAFNKNTIVY